MDRTTTATTWPPKIVTADDIRAAEDRLRAALGAVTAWAAEHGHEPAADRGALWNGYRHAHGLFVAFTGLDDVAFGGGR